jgi:hypothetical protein
MMTSVWVPIVSALAALLGVAVGQAWQARREQRRWKWERELDAEHREEQRHRDREMWAREDRNRFTEQKRQIYIDYQNYAYSISVFLFETSYSLRKTQGSGGEHNLGKGTSLDDPNYAKRFAEKRENLGVIRNHVRLMAPSAVLVAIARIDQVLIPAVNVLQEADPGKVHDLWVGLRAARLELFNTMRQDLNPGSSLLTEAETWPV